MRVLTLKHKIRTSKQDTCSEANMGNCKSKASHQVVIEQRQQQHYYAHHEPQKSAFRYNNNTKQIIYVGDDAEATEVTALASHEGDASVSTISKDCYKCGREFQVQERSLLGEITQFLEEDEDENSTVYSLSTRGRASPMFLFSPEQQRTLEEQRLRSIKKEDYQRDEIMSPYDPYKKFNYDGGVDTSNREESVSPLAFGHDGVSPKHSFTYDAHDVPAIISKPSVDSAESQDSSTLDGLLHLGSASVQSDLLSRKEDIGKSSSSEDLELRLDTPRINSVVQNAGNILASPLNESYNSQLELLEQDTMEDEDFINCLKNVHLASPDVGDIPLQSSIAVESKNSDDEESLEEDNGYFKLEEDAFEEANENEEPLTFQKVVEEPSMRSDSYYSDPDEESSTESEADQEIANINRMYLADADISDNGTFDDEDEGENKCEDNDDLDESIMEEAFEEVSRMSGLAGVTEKSETEDVDTENEKDQVEPQQEESPKHIDELEHSFGEEAMKDESLVSEVSEKNIRGRSNDDMDEVNNMKTENPYNTDVDNNIDIVANKVEEEYNKNTISKDTVSLKHDESTNTTSFPSTSETGPLEEDSLESSSRSDLESLESETSEVEKPPSFYKYFGNSVEKANDALNESKISQFSNANDISYSDMSGNQSNSFVSDNDDGLSFSEEEDLLSIDNTEKNDPSLSFDVQETNGDQILVESKSDNKDVLIESIESKIIVQEKNDEKSEQSNLRQNSPDICHEISPLTLPPIKEKILIADIDVVSKQSPIKGQSVESICERSDFSSFPETANADDDDVSLVSNEDVATANVSEQLEDHSVKIDNSHTMDKPLVDHNMTPSRSRSRKSLLPKVPQNSPMRFNSPYKGARKSSIQPPSPGRALRINTFRALEEITSPEFQLSTPLNKEECLKETKKVPSSVKSYISDQTVTPKSVPWDEREKASSTIKERSRIPPSIESKREAVQKCSETPKKKKTKCVTKWDPYVHIDKAGCERCLSLCTRAQVEDFFKFGRHQSVTKTSGGCCKTCTRYDGERFYERDCVILCRICFNAVHRRPLKKKRDDDASSTGARSLASDWSI